MSELSPIHFSSPGLPIPKNGKTDSNREDRANPPDLNARTENPFEITKRIRLHVTNLKKPHYPRTQLKTAVNIFRSIIPPDKSFKVLQACSRVWCYYNNYNGLRKTEGGLELHYERDRSTLKREQGDLLPEQILETEVERATCTELCYLLVASLRAVGIEAYIKIKPGYTAGIPGHVYVIAEPAGVKYKLDPVCRIFSKTDENGDEDRHGFAVYYINKGKSLSLQGKLKKAMECFEIAHEFKPDLAAAWNNKGSIFRKQGEFKKARECYERALKYEPKYVFALINKGNLLRDQGRLEEAIKCYKKVLGFKRDYAQAWYKIGETFREQGELKKAKRYFDKAFELKPDLFKDNNKVALSK